MPKFFCCLKVFLSLVFLLFFSATVFGAYVAVQTTGAPFDINESIRFFGTLSGTADLNVFLTNSAGTVTDQNYLGSQSNNFAVSYSLATAGDYNVTVIDLNNNVRASVPFLVTAVSRVALNWDSTSMKPPFSTSQGTTRFLVTFTAYRSNDANIGSGQDLNALLFNTVGTVFDSNSGLTNGDGNVQLTFTLPSTAGDYYFAVSDGNQWLSSFSFPIYSFKMIATIQNPDTNESQDTFKPSSSVRFVAEVKNYAGTQYLGGATATVKVYDTNNSLLQSIDLNAADLNSGQYTQLFTTPSAAGTYYADVNVTYGGISQAQRLVMTVQNYKLAFFASKYSGGGMGELEKMPSIYPTSATIAMEAHVIDTNQSVGELSGDSLAFICNNTGIGDHNFSVRYRQIGKTDWNVALGESDVNSTRTSNYCRIDFAGPAAAGVYEVQLQATDLNVLNSTLNFTATAMIVVQNYFVFLEPIDSSSCDTSAGGDIAASCGFKFSFTKGQKIGLRATIIDMRTAGTHNKLNAVRGAVLFGPSGEIALSSPLDVNLRTDLNVLEVDTNSATFQSVSGGFYNGGFTVDVNANGTSLQSNVTAFGFFYMQVLNATLTFVDANHNTVESHGMATYKNDQNTYVKVTVLDSDGTTAIRGATVTVSRLVNFKQMRQYTASLVDSNATNSDGIAYLVLDKDRLGLTSGEIEIALDINAATVSKTDSVMGMFERRNYFLDVRPFNAANCMDQMMIAGDQNITVIGQAYNPFGWGSVDINFLSARVYYEGSPTKPLDSPRQMDVSTTPKMLNCQGTLYAAIDINHTGGRWDNGFYRAFVTVNGTSGQGLETASAFFKVQPFNVLINPNSTSATKATFYVSPGTQWDFNIFSDANVNLTVKLINMKSWTVFDSNVHIYDHATGTQLNASTDGNDLVSARWYTIDANIPATLPLATEDRDGYLLEVDANRTSDGNASSVELFVLSKKWQLFPVKEWQGVWMQGMPGPYFFTSQGTGANMFVDSNVVNDCNAAGHAIPDINTMGITYDRIIKPRTDLTTDLNWGHVTDFNRFVLVNTVDRNVYIDRDNDCNWADSLDRTALRIGNYAPDFNTVRAYMNYLQCGPGGCPYAANPFDGKPVITGINKSKLSYATLKLLQDLNSGTVTTTDPFMGEIETDVNWGIPVLVKDLNDMPVQNVVVTVYSVMKAEMGGGMPQQLPTSDYNKFDANTDSNGLAVPIVAFKDPGIFMLGLKLSKGGTTQTLMPFNGVVVKAGGFSVTMTAGLDDINIVYDVNITATGYPANWLDLNFLKMDFNRGGIPLTCFDGNSTKIGFFSERRQNINLDNDANQGGNNAYYGPIMDENWFFIPLNGTCQNGARLLIDDDYYIDRNTDDGQNESILKQGQTGSASGNHLDLNELLVTDENSFPICLYGTGLCSGASSQNTNFGAQYDLNADTNILNDVNMYNYFNSNKIFDPAVLYSNPGYKKYIRLDIKDYDNAYVSGTATVTGTITNERTGVVKGSISGSIINGLGRIVIPYNLTFDSNDMGTGYMINLDVTLNGETTKSFNWMESHYR